jgi:hypothetical protein
MSHNAKLWVGDSDDPMNGEVVLENVAGNVTIERTDEDEVAIHATLPGDQNAIASFYLSNAEAALLAAQLGATAAGEGR